MCTFSLRVALLRYSGPNDGLFFKHQRKEEDYVLEPTWAEEAAATLCRPDGTKGSEGPVAKLAGWELFEHQIHAGGWRDLEKEM